MGVVLGEFRNNGKIWGQRVKKLIKETLTMNDDVMLLHNLTIILLIPSIHHLIRFS